MPEYRFYELRKDGHPSRKPQLVTCKSDSEAEQMARVLLNVHALEVWCGERKVMTIEPSI